MAYDAHANFAYSTVLTPPSPANSGNSITVQAGDGAKFPAAPFNCTVWPAGANPLVSNAEIVRVTQVVGDVLTVSRQQEGSSARSIVAGDQIANTITTKIITDIEGATTGAAGGDLTGNYPNPSIAAGAVTYAKMQNESASTLLGNPTGSPAAPSEITLGSGLAFSGTTLTSTVVSGVNYLVNGGCWFAQSSGIKGWHIGVQAQSTSNMDGSNDGYVLDQWKCGVTSGTASGTAQSVRMDKGDNLAANLTITGNTTNGSKLITNISALGVFEGMTITGTNIPANTIVTGIDATVSLASISNAATGTGSGITFTFGIGSILPGQSRYFGFVMNMANNGNTAINQKVMVYQPIDATTTQDLLADAILNASGQLTFQVAMIDPSGGGITVNIGILKYTGAADSIGAQLNSSWSTTTGTDPTWATGWSLVGSKTSCTLTNAWQLFSVSVTAPTTANNLAVVMWSDAQLQGGGNLSMPTTPNDGWGWKEAQLVPGGTAQPWRPSQITDELARAERFYWKSYNLDTAPGTVTLNGSVTTAAVSTAGYNVGFQFTTRMRAAGLATAYNPNSGATGSFRDATAAADKTASNPIQGERGCYWSCTAGAVGNTLEGHMTADARL